MKIQDPEEKTTTRKEKKTDHSCCWNDRGLLAEGQTPDTVTVIYNI